jgi:cytochrome c oxidase subunit III
VIPYTIERRQDTGVTNVTLGVWLFLASEAMLFGSLFSAYALLRVSAPAWPRGDDLLSVPMAMANTAMLLGCTGAAWRARTVRPAAARAWLLASTAFGVLFLLLKGLEYRHELSAGLLPSGSTFLASYFTLTGMHVLHVFGGAVANLWAAGGALRVDPRLLAGRTAGLSLYWAFVDLVWLVILVLFYLT